jgi:hypothetical protein
MGEQAAGDRMRCGRIKGEARASRCQNKNDLVKFKRRPLKITTAFSSLRNDSGK